MKIQTLLTCIITLGTLIAPIQADEPAKTAAVQRSTAQVSLRVDAKTVRQERKKKVKPSKTAEPARIDPKPEPETVTKTLDIEISAAKSIKGPLKIVTSWYGRDVEAKKPTMVKEEENEVALDASQTATLSIPPHNFVMTPAYKAKSEKIPASGESYYGWVIRAYEGDILVGESSSSPPLLKLNN